MVVVAGIAADVGRSGITGQRVNRARPPEQLECPIDRGEAKRRLLTSRSLEKVGSREASSTVGDHVEERAALRGQSRPRRQREAAVVAVLLRAVRGD